MILRDYLEFARRHLSLIVALPLICAVATTAFVCLEVSDTYTANVSIYVLTRSDGTSNAITGDELSASQSLTNDVLNLVKSDRVMDEVAVFLRADSLDAYDIDVVGNDSTRVITLSVEGPSAETAASIANGLAEAIDDVAREVMEVEAVKVIDEAHVPSVPNSSPRIVYVLAALLVGLLTALLLAAAMDALGTKIHSTDELEELAGVPLVGRFPKTGRAVGTLWARAKAESLSGGVDMRVFARTLFENIRLASLDDPVRSVVVTSSVSDEGKTVVAVELARAIAASGKTVVLVEADMRQGSLASVLRVRTSAGVATLLSGKVSLGHAVVPTRTKNLFFLDAEPGFSDPVGVLCSDRYLHVVGALRESYEYVVFDAPPLGAFADAAVLSTLTDGTLLVARLGFVRQGELLFARERLQKVSANIVGSCATFCRCRGSLRGNRALVKS